MLKKTNNKGITLIAMTVTVLIAIVLISVTIGAINGGLFDYAGKAKSDSETLDEKNGIKNAYIMAKDVSKTSMVTEQELQKQLDKVFGEKNTLAYSTQTGFEVFIVNTERYYELDSNNNLIEKTYIKDTKPANFYYDKNGNALDGNAAHPYEISCIEDLVAFANLTNGVGNYFNANGDVTAITSKNQFKNKVFVLTRTLNFESPASYGDLSIKWSYNSTNDAYEINENSTTNLKDIITDKNGVGFVPISIDTGSGNLMFSGTLDGRGFEIQGLYEKREGACGLFRSMCEATIKNINVSGNLTASARGVGGITYISSSCNFYNCKTNLNINSSGSAGGILCEGWGAITVINCCNEGNLLSNKSCSGIVNWDDNGGTTIIVNCFNKGIIASNATR